MDKNVEDSRCAGRLLILQVTDHTFVTSSDYKDTVCKEAAISAYLYETFRFPYGHEKFII